MDSRALVTREEYWEKWRFFQRERGGGARCTMIGRSAEKETAGTWWSGGRPVVARGGGDHREVAAAGNNASHWRVPRT
jgi:hypothetical protein